MCTFAGFLNFQHNMCDRKDILLTMTKALFKQNSNKETLYLDEHINLGYCNLNTESKQELQPMTFSYNENTYTVIFTGQLYNSKELQKELIDNGHKFSEYSNAEIVLKAYLEWRKQYFQPI